MSTQILTIKPKGGLKSAVATATLAPRELIVTTDTYEAFVGNASGVAVPIVASSAATVNHALTADTWTTARTITLGTDASGSVSINGSANVTLNATLASVGTAGTKGETAAKTLTYGGTFKVLNATTDAKGRVTALNEWIMTMPATYTFPGLTKGTTTGTGAFVTDATISGTTITLAKDQNIKVPLSQLPDTILGQMEYGGKFVPSTGVATLTDNAITRLSYISGTTVTGPTITLTNNNTAITGWVHNQGIFYLASTAGTFATITFDVGDWLIATGEAWAKIDNTDAVTSVSGSGVITASPTLGAVVVSHAAQTIDTTANAGITLAYGGTFTAIGTATGNGTGHVTAIKPTTFTMPAAPTTYVHPAGGAASQALGLHKFSTDATSHIASVSAVVATDITSFALTNYAVGTNTALVATDTMLAAFGKIQAQINARPTTDTNTTYTFANGTNNFTVTPSNGSAQTVTVTPSIANNVVYTGTLVAGHVASYNDTTGTIKDSGFTIASNVPAGAVFTDNNTTYTFANGTNGFTVTPLSGTAQTVTVTPSITNNVISNGTTTAEYIAKFSAANTVTNGPAVSTIVFAGDIIDGGSF